MASKYAVTASVSILAALGYYKYNKQLKQMSEAKARLSFPYFHAAA